MDNSAESLLQAFWQKATIWVTFPVNDDVVFAGTVQWLHRAQAECASVPGSHLLPAPEAHGG